MRWIHFQVGTLMLIFHSIFEWLYWRETSGPDIQGVLKGLAQRISQASEDAEAVCHALLESSEKSVATSTFLLQLTLSHLVSQLVS